MSGKVRKEVKSMGKDYSHEEMEQIMKRNIDIPDTVERRIQETCEKIVLLSDSPDTGKHRKHRKSWRVIAAAAALIAALGATAIAATQLLTSRLTQNGGELTYSVSIDPEQKEAHEIQVTAAYVPDGFIFQDNENNIQNWYSEKTGAVLTIIPYNAAELYKMSRTQDEMLASLSGDNYVETITIRGTKADIFSNNTDYYIDSKNARQDIFLFNEEWGYAVHVYLNGPDLEDQEALKVAEGLDIEVLETTVPYPTDEEIARINEENERIDNTISAAAGISEDSIRGIGDVMTVDGDMYFVYEGIKYQALDIRITDSLPLEDYPKEQYLEDYDSTLAHYLNEDGTLKPHKRFISENSRETEDAEASFVIVTTRLCNTDAETKDVYLSPFLRYLDTSKDGSYTLSSQKTWPAQESWAALTTDGFPFFQSAPNNGWTQELYTTLDPGETIECTSVYVVDNDVLDTAYMQYFNVGAAAPDTPELYVKVTP